MQRRAVVTVYTRHMPSCVSIHRGEFYRGCSCPKWIRYSLNGHRHRQSADTRTWSAAEDRCIELQNQLDKGGSILIHVEPDRPTIEALLASFIQSKQSEGISPRRVKKLQHQLDLFERWMTERRKFYPSQITPTDVIEFRTSWNGQWGSGTTRQKAQQNLRAFLRFCCDTNLKPLLDALKTIRLAKEDRDRLEPKPFSEKEITTLLTQIPKTFPPEKIALATLLVKFMIATGLSIRDTLQLARQSINRDGWLRINRQKTSRPVRQHIDAALCKKLCDSDGEYIFWDGKGLITSAVTAWQDDLRQLMQDAGVWIRGNTSHRFRDTAVDFWLGQGWSMTEVAAALGDTVAVTERHYSNLASKRMESRLVKLPKRTWGAHV